MDSKVGDVRYFKEECRRIECGNCGEDATQKHTFLLPRARANPASSAYGKDDCSWCSDYEEFTCEECTRPEPFGYENCSTFKAGARFEHMFIHWHKTPIDPTAISKALSSEVTA